MKRKYNIEVDEDQMRLMISALDLYGRIGILQLDRILDHPTIDLELTKRFTPDIPLEVGVSTPRGEIVEMGDGYIKTKGRWGNGEEVKTWEDVENIRPSIKYSEYHPHKDMIRGKLNEIKNLITHDDLIRHQNASFGIANTRVDKTCTIAYDMLQVMRHQFWKEDENRSPVTVDSSVTILGSKTAIKVTPVEKVDKNG